MKRPAQRPCWNDKLTEKDLGDIEALKALVAEHKSQGLTIARITWSWVSRCIQTMKAHERYGFEYLGELDNDRTSPEPLFEEDIMEQVRKIISGIEERPTTPWELSTSIRPP